MKDLGETTYSCKNIVLNKLLKIMKRLKVILPLIIILISCNTSKENISNTTLEEQFIQPSYLQNTKNRSFQLTIPEDYVSPTPPHTLVRNTQKIYNLSEYFDKYEFNNSWNIPHEVIHELYFADDDTSNPERFHFQSYACKMLHHYLMKEQNTVEVIDASLFYLDILKKYNNKEALLITNTIEKVKPFISEDELSDYIQYAKEITIDVLGHAFQNYRQRGFLISASFTSSRNTG